MYQLSEFSTKAPQNLDKTAVKEESETLFKELNELQNLLYAESKHAVLIVLQGMDASGKDGVIRKVFGRLNPQGVQVYSFKSPTTLELSHDFLWRVHQHVPSKGMIQIFNRSHYEDVLITRVHGWCDDTLAQKRFRAINDFEKMLFEQNNTQILKFYLHISPEKQRERLQERLEDPTKHWKYDKSDFKEAKRWEQYARMYTDVFEHCSLFPWIIVPADQNWYKEHLVAKTLAHTLRGLNMKYPPLEEKLKEKF